MKPIIIPKPPVFRAGAAVGDLTPEKLPALVNGEFYERRFDQIDDPLSARALVLDDGKIRLAICVVDSCMVPESLCQKIRRQVAAETKLKPSHILISATHCHSAPSLTPILGTGIDDDYAETFPRRVANAIIEANGRLEPASFGYATGSDPENVFCRRFIMKPGTAWSEPLDFTGSTEDIAQMNPFDKQADIVCPTGRPDPTVRVAGFLTADGFPLALLGNYSTHYAGADQISADYFGVFAREMAARLGGDDRFVALMSNGTSGDANSIDFRHPERVFDRESVGKSVADAAEGAWRTIDFRFGTTLGVRSAKLTLGVRKPTSDQVEKAKEYLIEIGRERAAHPVEPAEVYARETLLLDAEPAERELTILAMRIGDLGIVGIPGEVYSETGREIRLLSPFPKTAIISLAGGCYGYIPTPDSFRLGGYTTWRARTSCLEETAEPKIRLAALRLLEKLAPTAMNQTDKTTE